MGRKEHRTVLLNAEDGYETVLYSTSTKSVSSTRSMDFRVDIKYQPSTVERVNTKKKVFIF